ncbi:MAG TPA: nickel-dependent hydrogenase large subunit [Burkholderiaceae bacterium]|nr:nickel-dependent hydrogenase large subunit [Burkholderiaceae bacterium]
MAEPRSVSLRVPVLARVEGEGALELDVRDGRIANLALRIFEPPRLFEKLLQGRSFDEVPDIVARICGICPVAYQMSAVHALERLFGTPIDAATRALRRLLYCGEWIESHALHIHLLAAPDYLGLRDVIAVAKAHPQVVARGLALQALGNEILRTLGGRSVHPVSVRVGGFARAPDVVALEALYARVEAALPEAEALLAWTARLPLPHDEQHFTCVALRHPDEYPMNEGRVTSDLDLDLDPESFETRFAERQVSHSTALHAALDGAPYLVGPLARLNLNADRLPPPVAAAIDRVGLRLPSRNMFHSIVARAAEILLALHEARRLLADYMAPDPAGPVTPRAGSGAWATEAPRGLLWHRYATDATGTITSARIVPPTSQNQARIEADLAASLTSLGLDRDDDTLRQRAETVIRNYDPCISCATHFLTLKVARA